MISGASSETLSYCRPTPIVSGEEHSVLIGKLTLESGESLAAPRIGFVTHGTLNARRDNALLLLPGTTNSRHAADGYIGAGKAFDPSRHFIVSFEALGSGISSKPSDGLGEGFPDYNIRDLVRCQYEVATGHLGLRRFDVAGASMGAFQALEWAVQHPGLVRDAVLVVPAARASNVFRGVVRAGREILQAAMAGREPGATMAGLAALKTVTRLYFPWTVSDAYLERVALADIEHEIAVSAERTAAWHYWDYLKRYQASASHDVSLPFGGDMAAALERVQARTLLVPTSSERLLGAASAGELQRGIRGARLAGIQTDRGHLGWRAVEGARESREITRAVADFFQQGAPP